MRVATVLAIVSALLVGMIVGATGARTLIARSTATEPRGNGWTQVGAAFPATWPLARMVERAARAIHAPLALPATEELVFAAKGDADGRSFNGASRYVLRLAANLAPQADVFWSVAVVTADGALPDIDGPSSWNSRAARPGRRPDGSVDLLIQSTPPDDPGATWIATPPGHFQIVIRVHGPPSSGGSWSPPAVMRQDTAA